MPREDESRSLRVPGSDSFEKMPPSGVMIGDERGGRRAGGRRASTNRSISGVGHVAAPAAAAAASPPPPPPPIPSSSSSHARSADSGLRQQRLAFPVCRQCVRCRGGGPKAWSEGGHLGQVLNGRCLHPFPTGYRVESPNGIRHTADTADSYIRCTYVCTVRIDESQAGGKRGSRASAVLARGERGREGC
jgi:hypothetical protein